MARMISLILLMVAVSPSYAASLQEQRHEGNVAYSNYIRSKVVELPRNIAVEVILKNGRTIKGTIQNYISYDDTLWVNPNGIHNVFQTEAFDISEIYDIVVVVMEPV